MAKLTRDEIPGGASWAEEPPLQEAEFRSNDGFTWTGWERENLMNAIHAEVQRIAEIAFGSEGVLRISGARHNCR